MTKTTFPHRSPWLISFGLALVVGVTLLLLRAGQDRQTIELNALDAEVVGSDFRFYFRYPGDDGILHSQDDRYGTRDFYVPAGALVRLRLGSRDYIYLLEVPEVGVYEVAAPDLVFDVCFVAPRDGQHDFLGSQMCGYDHSELLGKLIVQSPIEFRRTMKRLSQVPLQTAH